MANVWIDSEILETIGDALRYQHETNNKFYPREMANAIESSEGVTTLDDYFEYKLFSNIFKFEDTCSQIVKRLPKINISQNVTSLQSALASWKGTFSPIIGDNNVTDFSYIFQNCNYLNTLLPFDTSNGNNFSYMFYNCKNLVHVPKLDLSNGIDFSYMFYGCDSLISIPQLDTINGINFRFMFNGCSALASIPQLDTSNGENFDSMFAECISLTSIPLLDTSNGTNFSKMFYRCSLTTIPQLNTNNGIDFRDMFHYCDSLVSIPLLDMSNADKISGLLETYYREYILTLTDLGGFFKLGNAYEIAKEANYYNYELKLDGLPNLKHDSLINVINNLYNIFEKGCNVQKLTLGETNVAKLSAEEIAIATNKGWTIS